MQIQATHMGHGTMSNCVEETAGNAAGKIAISLVGNEGKTASSTFGNSQMQMQANGVIVAIKSNGSNGNNRVGNNGNNNCTKTCNGSNGNMGGVSKDNGGTAQVEVGVKSGSALPASSNGIKSVSALLNGMQLSYQAKAVDAVLTGKVTTNFLDENKDQDDANNNEKYQDEFKG